MICAFCFVLFSFQAFGLVDTDADGVADAQDQCPRVYARSETGCPMLAPTGPAFSLNACLTQEVGTGKMITVVKPLCDASTNTCTELTGVTGVAECDPIFPVIFDKTGIPLIRGPVFIVGYTQ